MLATSIGNISRHGPQAVSEELTGTSNDADCSGAGAKRTQELAIDACAAFIGHVGEQVHETHREHEAEGRRG